MASSGDCQVSDATQPRIRPRRELMRRQPLPPGTLEHQAHKPPGWGPPGSTYTAIGITRTP